MRRFILVKTENNVSKINKKRLIFLQDVEENIVISIGIVSEKKSFSTIREAQENDVKLYNEFDRNITFIKSLYFNRFGIYYKEGEKNIYLDINDRFELERYADMMKQKLMKKTSIRPIKYKQVKENEE